MALAPHTTLGLGGPAQHWAEVHDEAALEAALEAAYRQGLPIQLLGGGSNVIIADQGLTGLCLRLRTNDVRYEVLGGPEASVRVRAEAGVDWDALVADTLARGYAGLECFSGIPGQVGAVPIQNVGAYGAEVGALIEQVELLDLADGTRHTLMGDECGFGYRDSRFRRAIGRALITAVTFRLHAGPPAKPRYDELAKSLAACGPAPSLNDVRNTVLALRRSKSMVVAAEDAHSRSVGSFFQNPVLTLHTADQLAERWARHRQRTTAGTTTGTMPRFAVDPGHCKVPAAWLIEQAGFTKGIRRGAVGISPRHALSLVHYGGGSTAELLALASAVQSAVAEHFAVELHPEPVFMGFDTPPLLGAAVSHGQRLHQLPALGADSHR